MRNLLTHSSIQPGFSSSNVQRDSEEAEIRALELAIGLEKISLLRNFILMMVHYLLVVADLMPAKPQWALSLRSTYFAFFIAGDCADGAIMKKNSLIKEKLFMGPAFFTIASSFTRSATLCIPCLALHYKGHLGLENKPIIGNMIQQCKVTNPNLAIYNWISFGMLTVLLFYSFVNYLSLLCHNSYTVTEPLKAVYETHYAEKKQQQRWFIPWNRNARSRTISPGNPLHLIRTEEQRLALRFLLEQAAQPGWIVLSLNLSPYILTGATVVQSLPLAAFSSRLVYLVLFITFETYLLSRYRGNPIIRGTWFFRIAALSLTTSSFQIFPRTIFCVMKSRGLDAFANFAAKLAWFNLQCSSKTILDIICDWGSLLVQAFILAYILVSWIKLIIWRRLHITRVLPGGSPSEAIGLHV